MNLIHIPSFICSVPDPKAKDGTIKLVCRLNEEATAIVITACTSNGNVFTASFDEAELAKINNAADGSLDSDSFQKAMETAFSTKQVTASDASNHQLTIQFKAGGGQASFTLQQQNEGHAVVKFVEQMFELYNLRTDVQARETLMKETVRKQEESKKKEAQLQDDKKKQTEAMQQAQEEEKQAMEEYNKLNKELQALQHKLANDKTKDNTVDILAPCEPNLNACVGRYPLGNTATQREYDSFLMRMIKSKFTPLDEDVEDGDTPPEHMKVLRPFSKNEYEAQLKNLPDEPRRLIMSCMQKIDDWDFDVFAMQDFTQRGSLFHTAYALFVRYDFLRKFHLDEQIVLNFLSQVEAGYHPNPYHNSMHAADVLHILHYILSPGQLAKIAKLTEEDIFASLIAGMIHDYDHPGINNNFHIKVQSYLATLYNDRSILENHHCAEVFEIVKNPTYNVLSAFSEEQRRDIRETVIEMVLSTDMGLHAKILGTWKRRIAQDTDLHARKDDQRLALSMAIKMADISNCGRPEHLYLRWASKIAEEFFMQGDRERNLGNPVSPFMDRYVPSMSKGQIAFMNFIVIPLFESISEYLPEMHFSVDHCEHNKNYWAANDDTI